MADLAARDRDGEALFTANLDLIERVVAHVCWQHRVSAADADDFKSHVLERLIADHYAILAKFEGRSQLKTYLTVVVQHLCLDYRTAKWGKWRPSAEAKRAGPVGVLLEELLVRDGYDFEAACELLRTKHRVATPRPALERLAAQLPSRTRRRFDSDDVLVNVPSGERLADETAAERDHWRVANRVSEVLKKVTGSLEPADRLVLALRFEDGRSVADIATIMRLEPKPLYRRVERLLRTLREALEIEGLRPASVLSMFESPAITVEWLPDDVPEVPRMRPSKDKGADECR